MRAAINLELDTYETESELFLFAIYRELTIPIAYLKKRDEEGRLVNTAEWLKEQKKILRDEFVNPYEDG